MHASLTNLIAVLVLAPLIGAPQAESHSATVDRPARVALAGGHGTAGVPRFLDLTVKAYTPGKDGPVEAVVVADENGKQTEIGRFGLTGRRTFNQSLGDVGQSFSFPLPEGFAPTANARLEVRLQPVTGTAKGAIIEVSDGRLRF